MNNVFDELNQTFSDAAAGDCEKIPNRADSDQGAYPTPNTDTEHTPYPTDDSDAYQVTYPDPSDVAYEEAYQPRRLNTFSCEELCESRLERIPYTVEGLLRPGLTILAGSPKVGKSWMVLHFCMQVAKGLPIWGMETRQGSVLYIALEDSKQRLQERALAMSESYPPGLYFSLNCAQLGEPLAEELRSFAAEHRDARLVVIDTFQKIRAQGKELSYANDYHEVSRLKDIADELGICLLLIHHTRKQSDSDFMNEISGTNGIAGSADTLMVLKKECRSSRSATLSCTGRDIEDRELTLHFDREMFIWKVKSDTYVPEKRDMPKTLYLLVSFMMTKGYYYGTTADFTKEFCRASGVSIEPNHLKREMNRHRFDLEDEGVTFATIRRNTARMLAVTYNPGEKQQSDEEVQPSIDGDLF